jgi:(S)-ureidoglycine aminohydrolase
MNHLGHTRTRVTRRHAFIAPDGYVQTSLPAWKKTLGIILISPQMGARFSQYFALMQKGGEGTPPLPGIERFIFVLEGKVHIQTEADSIKLAPKGFAFFPAHEPHIITASSDAKLNVYERRFIKSESDEPLPIVTGNEQDIKGEPFMGNTNLICKKFLPDDPRFDMAVNTMNFEPGTVLPFAETHFMEHGMLMLSGSGIYRLEDNWYPIQKEDVLWMGPYCPQWFGALGEERSSYLLYKETNRDVFSFEKSS